MLPSFSVRVIFTQGTDDKLVITKFLARKNSFGNQSFLYEKKNGSFSNPDFPFETDIFHSTIAIFYILSSGSFRCQFLYKIPVVHLAIEILLPNNHCHALTYQTACSAQDRAHEQYCTCDSVVQSEYHVVYHCLVYEKPYFDESGN